MLELFKNGLASYPSILLVTLHSTETGIGLRPNGPLPLDVDILILLSLFFLFRQFAFTVLKGMATNSLDG